MNRIVHANSAVIYGSNRRLRRDRAHDPTVQLGIRRPFSSAPSRGWSMRTAIRRTAATLPLAGASSIEVRPVANDYEAVAVRRGAVQNEERFMFSAILVADDCVDLLGSGHGVDGTETLARLKAEFEDIRLYLSTTQVRDLVARVVGHLGGVELGGVNTYYMPPGGVEPFDTWRRQIGLISYHTTRFQVSTDEDTVAEVLNALANEVEAASLAIATRVESGDLTNRQARSLSSQADRLVRKIEAYEPVMGRSLGVLRSRIDTARQSLAVSTLLAYST
jgi:hypothetical protein